MKTEKVSNIPKNNNFLKCLLLCILLVNLPSFEVLSHINELDLCQLFKTEKYCQGLNIFTFGLWSSYQTWQF